MIGSRPSCTKCGKPAEKSRNHGIQTGWKSICYLCRRKGKPKVKKHTNNRNARATRRREKLSIVLGSTYARCGFVPEHKCQIDFDHVDGNKKNNDINNMQPLCSNCHRLKTIVFAKDYLSHPGRVHNSKELIETVRWRKAIAVS